MENAKNNVITATNIGCQTKVEYANVIPQMTEYQTTKNENKKRKIEDNIANFQQTKNSKEKESSTSSQSKEKPKILTKATAHQTGTETSSESPKNSNTGFANTIILTILATFSIGVIVGILYMLYQFGIK